MDHQNALRFGSSSSSVSTGASSQQQHRQQHHLHHHPHHHGIVQQASYSNETATGSLPMMQSFINNINEQHKTQHHQHHHHDQMMQQQTNDAADAAAAAAAAAALHANNPMLTYYITHGSTAMASSHAFPYDSSSIHHQKDAAVAAAQDLNFRNFSKASEASGILEKPGSVKIKVQASEGGADMETSASMAMAAYAASAAASAMSSNPDPAAIDEHKDKILAHPYFPRLVQAYANCHKIGAPPEVVATLDDVIEQYQSFRPAVPGSVGEDPELDEFMSAYSEKLQKHHDELTESLEEARTFLKRMEIQLNTLTKENQPRVAVEAGSTGKAGAVAAGATCGGGGGGGESSDEDDEEDGSCCDVDYHADMIDPVAEDSQLKQQLLRKYSSYMICSLKKEFLKRKKKGKLPKEARQKLLDWWTQHYKWPYPSENEKAALAEVTGLNQKQINNWFINQRKRHWKPSEDLQYVMVDANDLPAIQYPSLNANM